MVPHNPYEICPDEKGLLTVFGETVKQPSPKCNFNQNMSMNYVNKTFFITFKDQFLYAF